MKRLLKVIPMLLLMIVATGINAQQRVSVSGTVVDAKNLPLIGVAVVEKGTRNGVETNLDGKYSISVSSSNSILVFSYLGFVTKEVSVNDASVVVLNEDTQLLSEIVVIGYGQVRKKDATGAITVIKPELLNRGAVTSPQDLLVGKVAGVQITPGDGAPGSGPTIRIRGGASLKASNDPLLVIDGIPLANDAAPGMRNALASINPNDIESFTILKDASSTAIYGSRGSNGVIIINTKKGSKNFKLDYSSTYSVNQNIKTLNALSASEFKAKLEEAYPAGSTVANAIAALMGTYDTDWQKEIYQLGLSTDQNINLSGTVAKVLPYRISLGLNKQNGTLKTSSFDRYTASLTLTPTFLKDHLKVNGNLKFVNNNNQFADGGAVGAAVFFDPTKPMYNYNQDGTINTKLFNGYYNWGTIQNPNTLSGTNPLSLLHDKYDKSTTNRVIGVLELDYVVHNFQDLRAHLNVGFDAALGRGKNGVMWNSFQSIKDADFKSFGRSTTWRNLRRNQVLDFYLNYVKEIDAIKSKIDVMGGYSWQKVFKQDYSKEASNHLYNPVVKKETTFPTESALLSFFGRLNYTLMDRYLLTLTFRNDGSSRFAKENRWGMFPSAALAWQMNKESFLKDSKVVSDLKLKLGYGVTGQQELLLNDYPYIPLYNMSTVNSNYLFGSTFYSLLKPTGYDPNLKWEETTTYNIGLDFGFFSNRITGSVDVYKKETKDLLNEIDIAAGTNFANRIVTNIGSLKNDGVEFNINAIAIENKEMSWEIGFNATWNQTEITKLTASNNPNYLGVEAGDNLSSGTGGTIQRHVVGYKPNTFFVYQQVYDVNGNPIQNLVVDRNKDGQITEADRYLSEYSPTPKYYLGLNSMFKYKKFDLGFNMRANIGNYIFNDFAAANSSAANFTNQGFLTNMVDVVYKTGFIKTNAPQQLKSDYFVEDASFIKMDNLTLGYNFSKVLLDRLSGRLSFSVQNVFTITKYSGMDPEVFNGIDKNIWPRPRIYTLGLSLNF